MLIPCPWCGPCEENEFGYGGQAHVAYPTDPASMADAEWARHLFVRDNPRGWWRERWVHSAGCRQWFNLLRHTVTNQVGAAYPPFTAQPALPGATS